MESWLTGVLEKVSKSRTQKYNHLRVKVTAIQILTV